MKRLFQYFLIVISFLLVSQKLKATHVMGGEITWTCVGQDSFIINLTVYRDCNGVQIGAASVPIRCATTGTGITTASITTPSPIDITPRCDASCSRCQISSCSFPYGIEKYVYTKLVVLSNAGSCCKVKMSYSMCCRNSYITTGAANQNFYVEASLDRCITPCDNSPKFISPPISIICIGQKIVYNTGIVDVDTDSNTNKLDSLSIEWTQPRSSASGQIAYSGQYAYDKPVYFWGFPNKNLPFPRGFHLDPLVGEISFMPMKIEQTVLALKVSEWRSINGIRTLIGDVRRDMQIIVIACPNNNAPLLSSPFYKEVCAGDTIIFNIGSNDYDINDTLSLSWDKTIANASWNIINENLKHPMAIIRIPTAINNVGEYRYFSATVRDNACPVNGTQTRIYSYYINPPDTSFNSLAITKSHLSCGTYVFEVSHPNPLSNYTWHLYDNGWIEKTGSKIVKQYADTGSYPIILENSNYCTKTISTEVRLSNSYISVNINETANIYPSSFKQFNPHIKNNSGPVRFKWQDGDSINLNRYFYYDSKYKTRQVSITVYDGTGCSYTDSCMIYYGYAHVNAGTDVIKCQSDYVRLNGTYAILNPSLSYSSEAWYKKGNSSPISTNDRVYVKTPGHYIYEVTLSNYYTFSDTVEVSNWPVPGIDIGPDTTICSEIGLFPLVATPNSSNSYWSGSGLVKINDQFYVDCEHPNIHYGHPHYYKFYYYDSFNCRTESATKTIIIHESLPKPEIGSIAPLCIDNPQYYFSSSLFPGVFLGNGIVNDRYFDPELAGIGDHQIIYKVGSDHCSKYDTTIITVVPLPEVSLATKNGKTKFCKEYGDVELVGNPANGIFYGGRVSGKYFNSTNLIGQFNAFYIYTDQNGCSNTDTLEIISAVAWLSFLHTDTACLNSTVDVKAEFDFIDSIKWGNGSQADGYYSNHLSNTENTYWPGFTDKSKAGFWLYLRSNDPHCALIIDSSFITLNDTPFVSFIADKVNSQNGQWKVQFHTKSINYQHTIVNYQWGFGDGNKSNSINPLHIYENPGVYSVHLKITNDIGCSGSHKKENYIYIVNGIEEISNQNSIEIKPNPANTETRITSSKRIKEVSVYNSIGELIDQAILSDYHCTIERPGSGIFYLIIVDINNHLYKEKIIFR